MPIKCDPECGIIEGPRWNNFDVCPAEDYVCTFECSDFVGTGENRRWVDWVVDLYIINHGKLGQSYLYRTDETWAGSYGSGPLDTLFDIKFQPWKTILHILVTHGKFTWSRSVRL